MFDENQDDGARRELIAAEGQQPANYGAGQHQIRALVINGDELNTAYINSLNPQLRFIQRMIQCGIITQTQARQISLSVLNSLAKILAREVDLNAALRHFIFTPVNIMQGFADDRTGQRMFSHLHSHLIRSIRHAFSRQYPIFGATSDDDNPQEPHWILNGVQFVESLISGFIFPIKYLWPLSFYTLLTYDIHFFNQSPEQRYGNTIWNLLWGSTPNLTMTTQMGQEFVPYVTYWLGISLFMSAPFIFAGLNGLKSIIHSAVHFIEKRYKGTAIVNLRPDIIALEYGVENFETPQETIQKQLRFYHLFHYNLERLKFTLLHDGRLQPQQRRRYFEVLIDAVTRTRNLMRFHAISIATEILYHHHAGYTNHWHLDDDEEKLLQNLFQAIQHSPTTNLFRSYKLWLIGNNDSVKSHLFWDMTWLFKNILVLFAAIRINKVFIEKNIEAAEFYRAQARCEEKYKSWSEVIQLGKYACSMCGDWTNPHVYVRDIFTVQDCMNALLQQPRTPENIMDNLGDRFIHHPRTVSELIFSKQHWTSWSDKKFIEVLNLIKPTLTKKPDILDFSLPIDDTQTPPSDIKIAAIANLTKAHLPQQFIFKNVPVTAEQVEILGNGLIAKPNNVTTNIDFAAAKMGDSGAQVVANVIPQLPLLNRLCLTDNALHEEGITSVSQSIASRNGTNVYLDVSQNTPGDDGLNSIANAASKLSGVDISRCEEISEEGLYAIAQAIPDSPIEKFYAEEIGMSDLAFRSISQTFQRSNLTEVSVARNDLTDLGIAYGFSQTQNSTIKSFNIAGNILTDVGLSSITQDLPNSSVERIDISEGQFSAEAFADFLNATTQSHVNTVIARNNQLTNQTACDLTAILTDVRNPLQKIDVSDNAIGGVCDEALAEIIPHTNVTSFTADRTGLSNEFTTTLLHNLSQTPQSTFQNVSLEGNGLNQTVAHILGVTISATSLVSINMRNNSLGADCSDPLAKNMLSTSLTMDDLQNPKLPPAAYRELSFAKPKTHVTNIYLDDNQVQTKDAIAMCRMATQSKIAIQNLGLRENDVDSRVIDIHSCHVSAASSLQPFDWLGNFDQENVLPTTQSSFSPNDYNILMMIALLTFIIAFLSLLLQKCTTNLVPTRFVRTGAGLFNSFAGRVFAKEILGQNSEVQDEEQKRKLTM